MLDFTLMSHSKEWNFKLLKHTAYACVLHKKRTAVLTLILRKITLTPGLLDTVPQQGYLCYKLKD